MFTRRVLHSLLFVFLLTTTFFPAPVSSAGETFYVSPSGSDANFCSPTLPCREIRRALELVGAGDTILVADGVYQGFDVSDLHGLAGSPITIKAQGANAVIRKTTDRPDNRDTIFITFSSYIVVDGLRSFNANRAAIRVDQSPKVTVRNCVFGNNGTWGIFTDFSDDLLIENNETYGSIAEHGVYVSNSGDRPVVRGNRSHDNRGAGIHMNADVNSGGDGIITGAVIENNVIYNNGIGGGAGINMDGVQNSVVRNNVLYNNHATGIALFQIDGAEGPKGNKVLHNTVHQASDGRWALLVWRAWGTNFVGNNVLYHPNPARGGINFLSSADVVSTQSGYNVLDRITPDDGGTVYTLAQWKLQGHEPQSFSATPASLFVNAAAGDFHLAAGSPAIDSGFTLAAVTQDRDGNPRPLGAASDIGAYEAGGVSPSLMVTPISLDFGSVNVGSSKDLTLTVKNAGGGPLTGTISTSAPFSIVGASSGTLPAGRSAVLTVRFSPTVAGTISKTLSLTGGGGGSVYLSGTGLSSPPVLTVTPASLAFGSVNVGSSKDLTVTVKNVGGSTLAGSASTSAPFSIVGPSSGSLPAGQSAVLTVRFSPTAPGDTSGTLSLTGGGGGSVFLSGNGVSTSAGSAEGPVILFTDVEAGPTQGGPGNRGVPISLFGKGFGPLRGTSTVTINGVEVASYLIWGQQNANNSALDMIVVQPGPNATAGPIVVHVNGKSSSADHSFTPTNGSVYYVSPTGSDAASCSESSPCATILHVATSRMQPGDALLVRGGNLTDNEIWIRDVLGHSGQPGRPKVIRNHPGEQPVFVNASRPFILEANHVVVSGFHFTGGKSINAGNVTNRGNRVVNNTFRGVISWDAVSTHGDDHLIAGNDCNVTSSTVGTMGHCYYISHGQNLRILYNVGRGAPGYGIHIFDERRSTPDIQRVIANVLVEGNLVAGSTQRSGMMVSMQDQGSMGNRVDGVIIRNNIFTGNNHLGLIVTGIVRNVQIYNNTFYKNGRQGIHIADDSRVDGVDIRNNLIDQTANSNCTSNCAWFQDAHIQKGAQSRNVAVSNNYYAPAPALLIGTTDSAPTAGVAAFVNGDGLNFHLQDGSPAIDTGATISAVARDFDGRPRPAGARHDPGAFEHP